MQGEEFQGFPLRTIEFLQDIYNNNNRQWFQDNKQDYEDYIKKPSRQFSSVMESRLWALMDIPYDAKIFRIYRDLRFSKDKSPYNSYVHISFIPCGHKTEGVRWHFGLETEGLRIGVGIFVFSKEYLELYRSRIDRGEGRILDENLQLLTERGMRVSIEELKRVPKGYPVTHKYANLLRRKGLTVWREFGDPYIATGKGFIERCMETYTQMKPIADWLGSTYEENELRMYDIVHNKSS